MEKGHAFELSYLKALVDFMKENELDEIKVSEGEATIRMRRNLQPSQAMLPMNFMEAMSNMSAMNPMAQHAIAGASTAPAANHAGDEITGHILSSPMVGTFYRSPSPDAENFVNVGDSVKAGQTLCIIEAMKTMNQIEADKDGIITKVLVENAQPIEFGQKLFVIE